LEGIEVEQPINRNFSLTQRLAIFTALVSALTTIMSYHDASIQDEAFFLKNETLIAQAKASGLWAFYQAKSGKENVIQIIKHFSGDKGVGDYQKTLERYQNEKKQIRLEAEALERASHESNLESQRLMNNHQEGKGILLMQIAISLASITVLTRKKWLFAFAIVSALGGVALSIFSWVV
jgi:hypothetical protein